MYIISNFEIIYNIRPRKQICSEAIPGIFFFADNYKLFLNLLQANIQFQYLLKMSENQRFEMEH